MSAQTAELPGAPRRESALGVAGIAGGLLLIAIVFLWLWMARGREIDAAEQFRGTFAVQGVPPGWDVALAQAVPDGMFDLHTEVRIVRLVRSGSAPEPEPVAAPGAKVEWKKLPEAAPLGEPARLYLAWYDRSTGAKDVERQLDSHGAGEIGMLGEQGGKVRVDAGRLRWGSYDADFVHERLFEKGSFRDALRVNLSTQGNFCVLNVLWKWGEKGSRESALKVLEQLPPPAK
jgi:hypothetical protein